MIFTIRSEQIADMVFMTGITISTADQRMDASLKRYTPSDLGIHTIETSMDVRTVPADFITEKHH